MRSGDESDQDAEAASEAPVRGRRIAELLASELTARDDGPLAGLELVDVDRDVAPDAFGALAYRVRLGPTKAADSGADDGNDEGSDDDSDSVVDSDDGGRHVADCFVHDDRVRLEFGAGLDRLPAVAADAGLRVRPKAVDPPRVLVFVEDTAQVKRALPVVGRVADELRDAA